MYIKSLKVKNFRTLQKDGGSFDMEFDSNFQIIAGANNSGKSNLLRSLNLFFNGSIEDNKFYEKEKDIPFHKGKYGTGTHAVTEIEVDIFLKSDEINKIKDLDKYIYNSNIIRTRCVFNDNEFSRYHSNIDGIFPNKNNIKNNIILTNSHPLSVFFRRIKFIFIPTHTDLTQKINDLVAEEILPSMMDGWGNIGLAKDIKNLKADLDIFDTRIKTILNKKNKLITKIFRETISLFPEIQAGIPINDYALEVSLKDDNLTDVLSKRIDLLIKDSSHKTIESKGSGIQKVALVTLLEYFSKNIANMARYTNPFLIWAIDEPESFMQPKLQKRLRQILEKVSLTHQIVISTHSPQLIDILKPENVKLFYLKTTPISITRKDNKTFFKKETQFFDINNDDFILKLKEHLGVENNDGWLLQNCNILFEGYDDIVYFNSTFKKIMGYTLQASNISCESASNMPSFCELLYQRIADKKMKSKTLFCLLDNDVAGRDAYDKIKTKKFLKPFKTISMYLNNKDDQNINYPSMIEDFVIPEIFYESIISFLFKRNSKFDRKKYNVTNFISERVKMKRTPMHEFLDNYFDSDIKTIKNFTFKNLPVKYGTSLEYQIIINEKTSESIRAYSIKYKKLFDFLLKFK